jgi:hypothetical protein
VFRCAIVAYSNSQQFSYDEMYPTPRDKIQAFFTTHM